MQPARLGPVITDLAGTTVARSEWDMLRHRNLGGVILFSRNYDEPRQLGSLCDEIRDTAGRRLLIAVDQEGGRVQRFKGGFSTLPPMAVFGRLYDTDPGRALECARQAALTMALELRTRGVDLSFAPVADLDRGVSTVVGDRAFHREPRAVAALCTAWRQGMADAGMAAVAKHFPGHGAVAADSHLDTPVDDRPLGEIEAEDLVPFARLVEAGLEGVMTAHVVYREVDAEVATFSRFWIREMLRARLGFDGVVFSDDLSMAGAGSAGGPGERARAALEAGCDALLVCNDRKAAIEVLDHVDGPARPLEPLLGRDIAPALPGLEGRVTRFSTTLQDLAADRAQG